MILNMLACCYELQPKEGFTTIVFVKGKGRYI